MYKNKSLIKLTNLFWENLELFLKGYVSFIIEFIKENPLVHRIS